MGGVKHARFFTPYVGSEYRRMGVKGKRVLVIGASFYCGFRECEFADLCTNSIRKDSSSYDLKCPPYKANGMQLHNEPSYCVEDMPRTYRNFANPVIDLLGVESSEQAWQHLAFTNYIQYMLDAEAGFRATRESDFSQRDFDAFVETCVELQPDIVIVWGCIINKPLIHNNPFVTDKEDIGMTKGYLCHMTVPGIPHPISIINSYHPSLFTFKFCRIPINNIDKPSANNVFERY